MNRTLTSSKLKRRRPHSKMWLAMPLRITPAEIDERPRAERRRVARKIVKGYEPTATHNGMSAQGGRSRYMPHIGAKQIGRGH